MNYYDAIELMTWRIFLFNIGSSSIIINLTFDFSVMMQVFKFQINQMSHQEFQ